MLVLVLGSESPLVYEASSTTNAVMQAIIDLSAAGKKVSKCLTGYPDVAVCAICRVTPSDSGLIYTCEYRGKLFDVECIWTSTHRTGLYSHHAKILGIGQMQVSFLTSEGEMTPYARHLTVGEIHA